MQVNRLFEMIYMLLDKECITAKEFADHFEISMRTVYRDVDILSMAGIPIYMKKGKGGGIALLSNFVLNKSVLTKSERAEILASLYALKNLRLDQSEETLQKMKSILGDENTDWIEVDFSNWNHSEEEAQSFELIKSAIIHKKVVEIMYYSSKRESSKREVLPLKLCFKAQAWYVYAYCKLREDFRFFKLRRIKDIKILEETVDIALCKRLFNHDSIYTNQKYTNQEIMDLELRIAPEMSYRVMDEFEYYEIDSKGYYICKLKVPNGEWLFSYLASYGEKCKVLKPEELKLELQDKLKAWLAAL